MLTFTVAPMTALLLLCSVQQAMAIDQTRDPGLIAKLNMAATQLDKLALLKDDVKDWTFSFKDQTAFYNFAPGGVINMNAATFPAARGNGMTLAMLNLGPCSILPVHLHPRAANYVVAVSGNTSTYMFEENGARTVKTVLTPGKATIFPAGSMHTMMNTGCDNAQLVSALNSDDPGTLNLGQMFTNGFPAEIINAALGSDFANPFTAAKVPTVGTGANWGPAECLKRCSITPGNSTTGETTNRRYYE